MQLRRARASALLLWLVACSGGGGKADPCAGPSVCSAPPGPQCLSATVSITFSGPGTCSDVGGAAHCEYTPTQVDCAASGKVCADEGACLGPCDIRRSGQGFVLYAADGNPDPAVVNFEIRAIRADGTCDQLVGTGPDSDLSPSWSAASGVVAWASWRDANWRVVLQDARGGAQRVLDTGPALATGPDISPDGTLVVYERLALGSATGDVYLVPAAGGTPTVLAANTIPSIPSCAANDAGPVFSVSAEGRFVYYVSTRGSAGCAASQIASDVWRQPIDAAGAPQGEPERITTDSAILGRPSVSPDGRTLAYARPLTEVTSQIILHDILSGTERALSTEDASEPAFSPTGDTLAARTNRYLSVGGDVVLLDATSGAVRKRLTSGESLVGSPAFPR